MWTKLSFLKKHLVINIPISMVMGVVFGYFFKPGFLKYAILPLTILMIFPMMVTLNLKSVFTKCQFKVQGLTQFINLLVIPLIGFGIGQLFFIDRPLIAFGLLLIALLPTSGMTISWTGFAKGNVTVAIKMTIIGLILGTMITPLYGKLLMGRVIKIPVLKTFIQIGLVIFVPMILGFLIQKGLVKKYGQNKFQKDIKPNFPLISTIAVLGIIFVAMALRAKTIVNNPKIFLTLIIPLIIFYFLNYTIISFLGRFFLEIPDAIALVYGTVMRNLSVALAIAITLFDKKGLEIALIIAMAFIIQVQSAAWYLKLVNKVFKVEAVDTKNIRVQ